MAVESKTMTISGKDVKDFMMSFDSPEEAIATLVHKANDLAKDVDTLVHSMANLFEQDALSYSMADVCIKVEMSGLGQTVFKTQIGNPGLLKHVAADIAKAKEEVNGI